MSGELTGADGVIRPRGTVAAFIVAALLLAGCAITDVAPDVVARRSDAAPPSTLDADPFVEVEAEAEVAEEAQHADEPSVDEPSVDELPEPASSVPETGETDDTTGDASRTPAPAPAPAPPGDSDDTLTDAEVDEIVEDLIANGFCEPTDFDDDGVVTAIHFVLAGELQDPCFVAQPDSGVDDVVFDDDPRLIVAWNELLAVTPASFVEDISLLAGFEACPQCDTLAYVTTLDVAAEFFIIAVDVVAAAADPDELRLTMLHELSHVFTQDPGEQLIVQGEAAPCETYFNGNGCFTENSYMWAWIQEFWPDEFLDTLPTDGGFGSDDDAFARCDENAGFVGSYAASHPEEDFAETFSAYVFDVEVDPAVADRYAFFDRYPEFVEVRDNARAAGLAGTTDDNFEGCGI